MPARSTDRPQVGEPASLAAAAAGALLEWYSDNARDLPWRRTDDPYRILVSEIMLQQTRVGTVIDRYPRFLERFPTLSALAEAREDAVLAEWSGLGYYRRARNLHRLARQVVAEHDGRLPADHAALRALPGVGEYTAASVASIAFGLPRLGIDGNVKRVLARLLGWTENPDTATARRAFRNAARAALRAHEPGTLNQALIELGATVCTPASPDCRACPLQSGCITNLEALTETIPPRRTSRIDNVLEAAAVLERDGAFLMLRGQRPGHLTPMWEFPTVDSRARDGLVAEAAEALVEVADELPGIPDELAESLAGYLARLGLNVRRLRYLGEIRHAITTRRIRCQIYRAEGCDLARMEPAGAKADWIELERVDSIPLAASARKTLELLATDPS